MLGWIERSLLYFPTHEVAHAVSAFGPSAEEVWFGEHARLHGVYVPASPDRAGPHRLTFLIFHGNGGNLSHRAPLLARLHAELGAGLFIIDYQGYGKSSGQPSVAGTAVDARAALAYLRGRSDVDPARIVYYGESLGGAVAIELASEFPPAALVVQSSFTSVGDMARLHYPALRFLLPLIPAWYDSLATVGQIDAPLLLIHGDSDTLVPIEHSRRLLERANEPKRLLVVPGAGHNDVLIKGGPEFWQSLRAFVSGLDDAAR